MTLIEERLIVLTTLRQNSHWRTTKMSNDGSLLNCDYDFLGVRRRVAITAKQLHMYQAMFVVLGLSDDDKFKQWLNAQLDRLFQTAHDLEQSVPIFV